ncbi:MAG: 50S ribosomal protein L2 [Candidatus Omnitrophica bacterium]|nr:50S ribosomal protein L2 [Candidatus Omnitrophota bacterium]
MPIRKYKPTTPTRRFASVLRFDHLTAQRPYKPLTFMKKGAGGRNAHGHITCQHQGGGHKRRHRIIDFKREKHDMKATVLSLEYDPNRSAHIALVQYTDSEKRYILAPDGLKVGDVVMSGENVELKVGNHTPLGAIPPGTPIHNIEFHPGQGGKLVRAAGTLAEIAAKEDPFCHIKMPSGEIRMIKLDCYATIGQCSNGDHEQIVYGKAGRKRWLGIRPTVRGVAMNPVDHPHGGGEGKTSGGGHPSTPWGVSTKGFKTRKKNKASKKFIIRDRRKK